MGEIGLDEQNKNKREWMKTLCNCKLWTTNYCKSRSKKRENDVILLNNRKIKEKLRNKIKLESRYKLMAVKLNTLKLYRRGKNDVILKIHFLKG